MEAIIKVFLATFFFCGGPVTPSTDTDSVRIISANAAPTLTQLKESDSDPNSSFYCDTNELVNTTMLHNASNEVCDVKITDQSAHYIKHTLHSWSPNFARLILAFPDNHTCIKKRDIIMPHHWFWTYYSPDGYFPYLKWPIDFSRLSFGLLDVKTYPKNITVFFQVNSPNCTIFMGDSKTTQAICEAFRQLTDQYLVKINSRFYSYSYWCFLAERPNERNSWDYFFGVYFGFVSDFVGYNCCRTGYNDSATKEPGTLGLKYLEQIRKMRQCTIIPNIISLIIFAYFPLCLTKFGKSDVRVDERYQGITPDDDFVFLSGHSSFIILTNICELMSCISRTHHVLLSRVRRFMFILLTPCIIYVQLAVYQNDEVVKSFIRHGMPISYISMVGGFEESQNCFLPCFGGPFILLLSFFLGCLIFLLVPESLRGVLENEEEPVCGLISPREYHRSVVIPFSIGDATLEDLSSIPLSKQSGYCKMGKRCQAGIYMVLNPQFWRFFVKCQIERYTFVRGLVPVNLRHRTAYTCLFILGSSLYIFACTIEIVLCAIYFGIPLFAFIKHIVKCYINSIMRKLFLVRQNDISEKPSILMKLLSLFIVFFVAVPFIFFIISVCTVFSASISYIVLVTVFSFLAVIVYPSYSFGYIFFGIAFIYYFLKRIQAMKEIYIELLHDAIEISERLQEHVLGPYFMNETLVVKNVQNVPFDKLQVNGRTVELTEFQREVLHDNDVQASNINVSKVKSKNGELGIPRDLFNRLLQEYRPIHIQVISAMVRLGLILTLIIITLSIVMRGSYQQKAAMSEVIHVIFMVAIGALPRVLEIALSTITDSMKKEIELRRMAVTIEHYWQEKSRITCIN